MAPFAGQLNSEATGGGSRLGRGRCRSVGGHLLGVAEGSGSLGAGAAPRASAARLTNPSAPAVLPAEAAVGALVEGPSSALDAA